MPGGLKQHLKERLSGNELAAVKRGFDIIGDIAILEIPASLRKRERLIARALLELHPNIRTVLKKAGEHTGRFRTRKAVFLAGVRKTETVHSENRVRLRLDVSRMYFSPRLASERLRISRQVKKGESVLVLFSGCGPYPLVIAKNAKPKKVCGIELNPAAHRYAVENAGLNRLSNIAFIEGDVSKSRESLGRFDRVVAARPRLKQGFLRESLSFVKRGGILHYYDFMEEKDIKGFSQMLAGKCETLGRKCRVLRVVKCGQVAPYRYRVCADTRVW